MAAAKSFDPCGTSQRMQTICLSESALTIFSASNGSFGASAGGCVPLVDSRLGQVNRPNAATWRDLGKQLLAESERARFVEVRCRYAFRSLVSGPHLNDLCALPGKAIGAPGREA